MPSRLTADLEIIPYATRKLDDPELPTPKGGDLLRVRLQDGIPFDLDDVRLAMRPESELVLEVFNGPDDEDPDGVLEWAPPGAWMKTRLEGRLGVSGGLGAGIVGVDTRLNGLLVHASYVRHAPSLPTVGEAARQALAGAPLAFDVSDVLALAPGDALLLKTAGAMSAKVEVAWADVLFNRATRVAELVPGARSLGLKVPTALKAAAEVEVKGDFALVLRGREDGALGVELSNRRQRALSLSADAGIRATVRLSTLDLKTILAAFLGVEAVGAVFKLLEGEVLSPLEAELVETALAIAGIDVRETAPAALAERVRSFVTTVQARLNQLAEQTIEAGFRYDFSRLEEDRVVLELVVPRSDFTRALHGALLRRRIPDVLDFTRSRPGSLKRYLSEERLVESRAWGFSLNVGRWLRVTGKDTSRHELRTTLSGDDPDRLRRHVAYLGARGYEDAGRRWLLDLRAETRGFSAAEAPLAGELDVSLGLLEERRRSLSEGALEELVDRAVLWGVCDDGDPSIRERLSALGGQKVKAVFQIRVDAEDAPDLVRAFREAGSDELSRALAAALPHRPEPAERRAVSSREAVYSGLWRLYLGSGLPHSSEGLSQAIRSSLAGASPRPSDALLGWETLSTRGSSPDAASFASVLRSIDWEPSRPRTIRDRVSRLLEAFRQLHEERVLPHEHVLPRVLRNVAGMGSQSFLLAALGRLVVESARRAGVLASVERSLLVEPEAGVDGGVSMVFGPGSGSRA